MTLRFFILLCGIIASAMPPRLAWSQQQNRVALIIDNASYPDSPSSLPTAIKDARLLADELRRNGFDVDVKDNAGKEDLLRAIDTFTGKIHNGSVALFYFSGFGIQTERRTYLIPVSAEIWSEADLKRDGISLDTIVAEMHHKGARAKIVIIDASRRNPFERRFRQTADGLAALNAPENTLTMYSAALGAIINDHAGDNSLFVGELVKEMRTPNLTMEEVFNHTRVGVSRASKDEQIPWVSSSLTEELRLGPTTGPAANEAAAAPRAPAAGEGEPVSSAAATPSVSATRPTETLVPETIPLISDHSRAIIRDAYMSAPDHKALAISTGPIGFITDQSDDDTAKIAALDKCQQLADALPQRRRCELYAVGHTVVYARAHPPMPPAPWVTQESSITKPLVANDIPLVSDTGKANIDRNYVPARTPKALALAPFGGFSWVVNQASGEEAERRALEICGNSAGVACLLVAVDNAFVVPIPTTMKAVGFFQAAGAAAIAPKLRDEVARSLGNSNGWTAVAAGASGQTGLMLKATSEQAAVDGAMANCARQDHSCRVIAIGPFAVEPK